MSKRSILTAAAAAMLVCVMQFGAAATVPVSHKTLTAFTSDQELTATLARWREQQRRREVSRRKSAGAALADAESQAAPAPAASEAVTNVQHAGVDEGGIVKVHGDHLVVLRRGRLFTVRMGDGDLQPVSTVDAFGPGIDPNGAWYDELLISGNTIVVIGYSYARGGSEIGLFDIAADGQLSYRSTHHLRSNDYYSSRNYASRLIGEQLIMYAPLYLNPHAEDVFGQLPAVRRWQRGARNEDFERIAPATRIYRTDADLDIDSGIALHSVTLCQLTKLELDCKSTVVMGPPGHVFYVSPSSVYVWATQWRFQVRDTQQYRPESSVFRIPLDGSAPSALRAVGSPIDQFSFLEEAGHLNVLLRADGSGDGMWAAETSGGALALMRVPLNSFSDGKDSVPRVAYQRLPTPEDGQAIQSRYVGEYLLYGAGTGWYRPRAVTEAALYAVRYAQRGSVFAVGLAHTVDRIEALGGNAVVVGSNGKDLHFTSVRLGRYPAAAGNYVRANAAQGETRSHGFFYKSDAPGRGLLGLPIIGGSSSAAHQLTQTAAGVLYLRNEGLQFSELGALRTRAGAQRDDGCRASCVDWYGNARPLFLRGRVFALLGYEIVEGRIADGQISEIRRIDFAPGARIYTRN